MIGPEPSREDYEPPPDLNPSVAEEGYLAQIEGLQRELRDAKDENERLFKANETAWRERDEIVKQLTTADDLLRSCIKLLAHFAGTR